MIDVIGNIVIANPTRQKYFDASLCSLNNIRENIDKIDIDIDNYNPHSEVMIQAINRSKSLYFLNFEEDHFCVCENEIYFEHLILFCKKFKVDVIKTSFHTIEIECAKHITDIMFENELVKIFRMTFENFKKFQTPYVRYYLGTNCIFKNQYAQKVFSRFSNRPHELELTYYEHDMEYTCAIPKFEILRPIDDDHGAENTCMLKNPTPQFLELIQ